MTLHLSFGMHSTIFSVLSNGEFDHDPWPICKFDNSDGDALYYEASKQKYEI